jgi:peptidoglycan/LPS O-acetylase OafA/YrhL
MLMQTEPNTKVTVPDPPDSNGTAAAFRKKRSALLDCIRAVAILAVLIFHVAKLYDPAALDAVGQYFYQHGRLGVDVFFPLSGFLITGYLLCADSRAAIGIFFQRRIFRILPLYLVAVSAFLGAALVVGHDSENVHRIWIPYLFLTGWFIFTDGIEHVPYTITWSLSVEEFAYILFGLLAWMDRSRLPIYLALIIVLSTGLRLVLTVPEIQTDFNHFPPARLDSIAVGGLIAWMLQQRRLRDGLCVGLTLLTLTGYLLAVWMPQLWPTLKYTCISLGTCAIIVLFETRLRGMSSRTVDVGASVGFYSYFTYLFHTFNIHALVIIWQAFEVDGLPPFWTLVFASYAVTHVQAMISFKWFEGPLIAFGRRREVGYSSGKQDEEDARIRIGQENPSLREGKGVQY